MKFIYPEGATPLDDVSSLKPKWVKNQKDLNEVEVENISQAADKYLLRSIQDPRKWFNIPFLQKIHYDMFCDVWDWAGKFRKTETCPGIKPFQIPFSLGQLCDDVQFWLGGGGNFTPLEQAVKIHHRLVFIHPFANGNGRFSRLVSDRFLKFFKCAIPQWPIDLDKNGLYRKKYITALREADKGNYEPLELYVRECCGSIL